ncbi:MAG: CRP/FNR family transcriptional regulator [Gammaproteobacteria bacterium]|jgi:CRP/FNR family transcriptional regulator
MQLIDLSKIKVSCEKCNLNEICLPRGLGSDDIKKLEDVASQIEVLHKGDSLFNSEDEFKFLYAVRSGCIKLTTTSEDGDEQILGFYLAGEIVGLDGIEDHKHSCTAVALETTSVCAFSYSSLSEVCSHVPALNEQMFQLMGRELSHENKMLLTITKKHADARITTFLLSLSVRYKKLGYSATNFILPMSRSEIGNYLDLTFETVSRSLSKLQKKGVIQINGKEINILNLPALKDICSDNSIQENIKNSVS